jgi:hypothetical protein
MARADLPVTVAVLRTELNAVIKRLDDQDEARSHLAERVAASHADFSQKLAVLVRQADELAGRKQAWLDLKSGVAFGVALAAFFGIDRWLK